eukprot:NODE_2991_length_2109_cov_7.969223.p3 GENE.NODE_2991_length_2109_cov_7.969223~~NODE_2991_length_2109_cov_7.969223.p3  ORF type:complete len:281 (+),score=106.39 NODE_2991_length_2109_cov_7.969223:550-1392(+)
MQLPAPDAEEDVRAAEEVLAALGRTGAEAHANTAISEFVRLHTRVDPIHIVDDPYTVAPLFPERERNTGDDMPEVALAVGPRQMAVVRAENLEASATKWQEATRLAAEAREALAEARVELAAWREKGGAAGAPDASREALRNALQTRLARLEVLKERVMDGERADMHALEAALEEACVADVGIWDASLIETAGQKINLFKAYAEIERLMEELAAGGDDGTPADAKDELAQHVASLKPLQDALQQKEIPVAPDAIKEEVLQQAIEAVDGAAGAGAGGDGAP